jgi:hypothetical protein
MKQPLIRVIQRPSPAAPGRALVECSVFFRLLPGLIVLPVLLAAPPPAFAQSNTVPGPTDYAAFSRFIADRNIFDPNRTPHDAVHEPAYHPRVSRTAPVFTLVGTMSYAKGMFAFFDGNQPDLRKVLYTADSNSIAGFTVAGITLSGCPKANYPSWPVRRRRKQPPQTTTLPTPTPPRRPPGPPMTF